MDISICLDDAETTSTNEYDETTIEGLNLTVDTDHISAAHMLLQTHKFIESVSVEAYVTCEYSDGKIRGGNVSVTRYGVYAVYYNAFTGTEWSTEVHDSRIPVYQPA